MTRAGIRFRETMVGILGASTDPASPIDLAVDLTIEIPRLPASTRGNAEMRYRIAFEGTRGTPMSLIGIKTLHRGNVGGLWRDVTVSDTRLAEGTSTIAAGTIRITPASVVREMTTVRGRGGSTVARAVSVVRFAAFFAGSILSAYRRRSAR